MTRPWPTLSLATCAALALACSPTSEGTPDAGEELVADAGNPPANEEVLSLDFETPALATPEGAESTGPAPASIKVLTGTLEVLRFNPTTAPDDASIGHQVLRLTPVEGQVVFDFDHLAIARPGEEWIVSLTIGVPAGGEVPYFEADLMGEFKAISYIDDERNDGLPPEAGKFKHVTSTGSFTGGDNRVLALRIKSGGAPLYIDNVKVSRKPVDGAPALLPYSMKLLNSSFEQLNIADDGASELVSGWTPAGGYVGVYSPLVPNRWNSKPFTAPGDGRNLLELGATAPTGSHLSSASSAPFAMAVLGQSYGYKFAVGRRLDLPSCRALTVSIFAEGNETAVAATTIDASTLTAGAFIEKSVQTGPITATHAGKALNLHVLVGDEQTGLEAPCRTDFDHFVAMP